jgi:hypothetical protein
MVFELSFGSLELRNAEPNKITAFTAIPHKLKSPLYAVD